MDEITNRKWAEREKEQLPFVGIEEGKGIQNKNKEWKKKKMSHKEGKIMRRKYYWSQRTRNIKKRGCQKFSQEYRGRGYCWIRKMGSP